MPRMPCAVPGSARCRSAFDRSSWWRSSRPRRRTRPGIPTTPTTGSPVPACRATTPVTDVTTGRDRVCSRAGRLMRRGSTATSGSRRDHSELVDSAQREPSRDGRSRSAAPRSRHGRRDDEGIQRHCTTSSTRPGSGRHKAGRTPRAPSVTWMSSLRLSRSVCRPSGGGAASGQAAANTGGLGAGARHGDRVLASGLTHATHPSAGPPGDVLLKRGRPPVPDRDFVSWPPGMGTGGRNARACLAVAAVVVPSDRPGEPTPWCR